MTTNSNVSTPRGGGHTEFITLPSANVQHIANPTHQPPVSNTHANNISWCNNIASCLWWCCNTECAVTGNYGRAHDVVWYKAICAKLCQCFGCIPCCARQAAHVAGYHYME